MIQLKTCEQLIQQINAALKNFSFYPKGHANISQPIKRAFDIMQDFFKEVDQISLSIHDGIMWVDELPIHQQVMWDTVGKILDRFERDAIILRRGLSLGELENFVSFMGAAKGNEEVDEVFSENVIFHQIERDQKKIARKVYSEALEVAKSVISEVRMGKIPKVDDVKAVVGKMVDTVLKDSKTMLALTLIKSYDDYLFHHSVNVSILCVALGEVLKLSPALLRELGTAAMLHDIGKITIDPKIVLKPDKLNDQEWEVMKQHPVNGYDLLKQMEGLTEIVFRVALEHHMRFDMSGYPNSDKGYQLHPASMILAICDTYDAMTTQRVYQRCFEPREALERMEQMSGVHYEPNYMKAFVKMLGIYPQGTLVKLSNGDTGVVSRPNPQSPDEPMIMIIYDAFGNKLEKPKVLDLAKKPVDEETHVRLSIVGTVNPSWHEIEITEYIYSS